MRIPRKQWPKYLHSFKELKGIYTGGGCVNDKNFSWANKDGSFILAHAHCYPDDIHRGWVCLGFKSRIRNRFLMLHEVAHLIAGYGHGHNDKWRRILLKIGGTLD
jgi:hypothetical protein